MRLLGVEWANKYYRYCADRMARWKVTNVRVMRTDGRALVMHHLPPACLSVLHVYHPDPWPKKRHHKRRLIQPPFVEAAVAALVPGGLWRVQSDHEEYFAWIRDLLRRHPALEEIPWEQSLWAGARDWEGTNYEVKYRHQGRAIYRIACRRRAP